MPSKLDFYSQLADHAARQLTGSFGQWTAFLETAGRLYKYPFHEQLMIFAQRPNATACAEYDLWNDTMRRYVRRGSTGIALIDTSGDRPRLKYVFDVADTGGRENSRRPFLWAYQDEHRDAVTGALEARFGVSGEKGLADQLEEIAAQLVREHWDDYQGDNLGILENSFLEEYDDFNVGAAFRNAATISTTYLLMSRCGLDPGEYFEHEHFLNVFDFNTPETIAALGTAISNSSEQVLRQIEVAIKNYEREKSLQKQAERTDEYGEQPELHAQRGLPDPEPEPDRERRQASREVRQDAEELSAGASSGAVEQHDPDGETVSPSAGDRRDGQPEAGTDDARAGESGGRDGGTESSRSDEVGGPDDELQSAGGGDHPERAGLRVSPFTDAAGTQLTLFPTQQEQMSLIDEAESVSHTPFAFSFSQEDIDHMLRLGSNSDNTRMKLAAAFQKQKPEESVIAMLKAEYHDGAGFKSENGEFSVWYDEDGIRLARGRTARYAGNAQVISWLDAAVRIGQLMEQGQFASNVELAEAEGYEREQLAQSLWYLCHDLSDEAKEQGYLASLQEIRATGFPEETAWLSERLTNPAFLRDFRNEFAAFLTAYSQNRSLMRFQYHQMQEIWEGLKDLSLSRRKYMSDMTQAPALDMFITEDEIDATLSSGSNVEGGKGRIYGYFLEQHTTKEKTDFLKKEYGISGRSHAVSRSSGSYEDSSGKGIRLQKAGCAGVELSWSKVMARVEALIRRDRYLTPEEKVRYEEKQREQIGAAEREQAFQTNYDSYNDIKREHPEDIVLFQVGDFFEMYGEDAKQAAAVLDLNLTTRPIAGAGRVEMCGVPAHRLEQYVEALRQTHSITISPLNAGDSKHTAYSMAKLGVAEEAVAEPVLAAETGANGPVSETEAPETGKDVSSAENAPVMRTELTQEDIDEALSRWNGDMESKRTVAQYMEQHGRERETAAWLSREYGGDPEKPLHITLSGSGATVELSWQKVQRRIAQLIKAGKFYTEAEYDRFDDVDPVAIREALAQRGIVNGEVVDPAALNNDPFIQQVMAAVERAAQEEAGHAEPLAAEYRSPGGIAYRAGDQVDANTASGDIVRITIERIEDGYVWYSIPSSPNQGAVDMFQERFEGYLDDGRFVMATPEQPEIAESNKPLGPSPSVREIYERYLPIVKKLVLEDVPYQNACKNSDRENAYLEGDAAIKRAVLTIEDASFLNLYHGLGGFHNNLRRDVLDGTYPVLSAAAEQQAEITESIAPEPEENTVPVQRDPLAPAYAVGDTVYLDNRPFQITEVSDYNVQLRDLSLAYPIFRAEKKTAFEVMLYRDARNDFITEYLAQDLNNSDGDLQDVLTWDGGLLEQRDKESIAGLFRDGESNSSIARYLSDTYGDRVDTMTMQTGEGADYFASTTGLEINIQDKYSTRHTFSWNEIAGILRAMYQQERDGFFHEPAQKEQAPEAAPTANDNGKPELVSETVAYYSGEKNHLPFDVVIQRLRVDEPERAPQITAENFRITDDNLGAGGQKTKFRANMDAINLLKQLEFENRQATPEEQHILSQYVGWGGLADAFDESKAGWKVEYDELKSVMTPEEYAAARASTLNAHYTSPTVIKAIYEAIGSMGFETGNILEPAMGVGNFFGLLPDKMSGSKLYGVELDSITGRIAKQLYPKADITVAGFETTDRKDFFDLAVGNVPFGSYKVNDRPYEKLGFSIHDYFFAKTLDQVRPGGVIAFVTSRYAMDKKSPEVRRYIAQRANLLGAIRLPNNAFKANAGTDVTTDIIFLQKRDRPTLNEPHWVHLGQTEDGIAVNSYFTEHPEMVLGTLKLDDMMYGDAKEVTCEPLPEANLADQLREAVQNIRGTYIEADLPDLGEGEQIDASIPADPSVKNYSYTVVDGEVYYRENSRMVRPELNTTAAERVKGMVGLRDCVQKLIAQQMDGYISDAAIRQTQQELNDLYDSFTAKYGLLNSRANSLAFADDSSYYLLCSLEVLDEDNNLKRKADMFTKRTIKPHQVVTSVDTASEALALSISEKARVDLEYMSQLTGKDAETLVNELSGVIFFDPVKREWQTADEYLSGNVREKLRIAQSYAAPGFPKDGIADYKMNVEALEKAQPKDLDASEIEVRLGATWIDKEYIQQFMFETFDTPYYLQRSMQVNYAEVTAEWNITGKNQPSYNDINAYVTYGTDRANAYKILEDTLNLRDVRIYDTVQDADGNERRVLNSKETTLAQQKQQAIKEAFQDWIWRDPDRRQALVRRYNELFNSTRPREYDGSHITFSGMNPEIQLREHQLNAVAHILYGGNTLLAHEVGAGKTFEMVAAAMESKRLGLCQKPLFVVPNHLTEQWASEFLRLYPSANILAATKKDFEPRNRKKFCARIATGDYDAIIIGHSQFERIPVSKERQEHLLMEQIWEIEDGIRELKASHAERFTIKSLERTKKGLEVKLKKLQDNARKDDVITFEELGVDRLYVDEAHSYKNLFLYTKMRNVAGLSTTDAQKSSDMLLKCRYIDELTDSRGVVFATGTPVSNSMTELYTMMRYLQHDTIRDKGLAHFDCWASTFGETTTSIELAPEGTGYRARTRFAKFFNLPELMNLFKEVADIKTADQLNLPTPTPLYHNVVAQPTEIQQAMVQELSQRASKVHAGLVDAKEDNMLKITSDGRKLGLDQRVVNPDLPDEPASKVNQCVDNIYRIWDEGQADKLTQLVFCDLSTPKVAAPAKRAAKSIAGNLDSPELHALERLADKDSGEDGRQFTIYDDIREKLIARGIPREQIAYIHEANTDTRKKELFSKVRAGQVRVLMGSTFKMGAGMNVQDRLVALHDLDAPWRPGDLEQRSGRIIRQGNMNPEVHIYRYVTEATFDAYLWQTLENKQKFISQIMTSKSPVRSCEDIDETALSYAEVKALCAGDDRIREKMDLDVDVARLRLLKSNHQSQQYRLEDNLLRHFPEQIEQNKGFVAGFEADMKTLAEHPHPTDGFAGMTVRGDVLTDKENAGAALLDAFKEVKGLEPVSIGSYRGFQMSLTLEDFGRDYVLTLKGQMSHRVTLGKDARGNLTRIDNALSGMSDRLTTVQARLEDLYAQMENAKAELGKPFPQEEELRVKSARLAELNVELNIDGRTPMEQLAEDGPATEIAKSARPSVLQKLHSYSAQAKAESDVQKSRKPQEKEER